MASPARATGTAAAPESDGADAKGESLPARPSVGPPRRLGDPNGDLVALAFLASPITLVAATSTTDFIWAVAFFVWAALFHLRDKLLPAVVLFALAIGCRSSTSLLIVSFLVADGWGPGRRVRCLQKFAGIVPVAILLYVPSYLAFDRTLNFLAHSDGWRGLANNSSRFLYKNYRS